MTSIQSKRTHYGMLGYADGVWVRDFKDGYYELRPLNGVGEITTASWEITLRPKAPVLPDGELRKLAQDAWCDAFGAL